MKRDAIQQMHELFASQVKNPSKAIVFMVKSGSLTPANIVRVLADHGLYPFGSLREMSSRASLRFDLMDLSKGDQKYSHWKT
ncbi:hypothetical protein [Pontiella sulfatireligans]|uniref:Uncharacterized protein n=1 Tax=Pontiella sulfatireligans TaxID=2750658 RepID=A0A6C2UKH2_9BACT|nr:hypothetical protein [Pontiella sulfatireligans]VGO19917.1 hypothetical protein SCARR_01977 [Pontiella sulfatireligans]